MGGHVFVVRGDLTALHCDHWLVPSSHGLHVSRSFWKPHLRAALTAAGAYHGAGMRQQTTIGARPAIPVTVPTGEPQPWLVDTTGGDPADVVRRARAFVDHVAPLGCTATTRHKPLIALPVVGTGGGGSRWQAGRVLQTLMAELDAAAGLHDVDIALVTWQADQYAAAQAQRRTQAFAGLSGALTATADHLAVQAQQGRLVLFLGAGVSMGAGLPSWATLLDRLADRAALSGDERTSLRQKSYLDQAEYIALRLRRAKQSVGHAVRAELERHTHYSLTHGLLASLPVTEAVTTNYDQLYERACKGARKTLAVLPWQPTKEAGPWLLKMHGCLDHPEDIVLTRQNYVRYAARNAALAGIVQAMLITKHMAFVGFSLSDDNFLRIVDEVRRAVHPEGEPTTGHRLGTALMLQRDPLTRSLWTEDMQWEDAFDEGDDFSAASRRLEIFWDLVGHRSTAAGYLLNPRFEAALSDADRALRALLAPLQDAPTLARQSHAFQQVRALLRALGGGG